jgi:hypothetical protein
MTRPLINEIDYRKDRSIIRFTSCSSAARGPVHGQVAGAKRNKPDEWFEAHLSSWRAEDIFRENAEMQFGQRASWAAGTLDNEGIFQDIYRPAWGMIPLMDNIGSATDDAHAHAAGVNRDGRACPRGSGERKFEYW